MLVDFRITVITWNVAVRPPSGDFNCLFGLNPPVNVSTLPDIYAIGLQEVSAKPQSLLYDVLFDDPWISSVKSLLFKWNYVKIRQVRLQGMVLLLFAKREHLIHFRGVQIAYTKTGLGGAWGNKGGVTVRVNISGCSICFVNCHLAAHDGELEQRIMEYNNILDKQQFQDPLTGSILTHDYVFWFGDLNFRLDVELTVDDILEKLEKENLVSLLEYDELKKVMRTGEAFGEFTERTPSFPPTYKMKVNSNDYDVLSRRPAWTDRILYRFTPNAYENVTLELKQLNYSSHSQYSCSDHKPVSSSFVVKVFRHPKETNVEFLPIHFWQLNQDSYAWYQFSDDTKPNTWDWIGLYRATFTGIDEHLHYVWASTKPDGPNSDTPSEEDTQNRDQDSSERPLYKITFVDQTLLIPGKYRLLYVSGRFDNVLGMSEIFQIASSIPDEQMESVGLRVTSAENSLEPTV